MDTIKQKECALPELLLSVRQVAESLKISRVTIYKLAKKGQLRLVKFGNRCTRVPLEEVLRLAESGASVLSGGKGVAA